MKLYKALFCFFFIFPVIKGYTTPVNFSHIGIDEGLSNNTVTKIFKDRFGFMWFGTLDGLNRYDGYSFKVYRNKFDDSFSLRNNSITALSEDRAGNLWVGTAEGISILNNKTLLFNSLNFIPYQSKISKPLSFKQTIYDIACTKGGTMLIASAETGLLVYKQEEGYARQICFKDNLSNKTAHYTVNSMFIDNDQKIWLLIENIGLCVFNEALQTITQESPQIFNCTAMKPDNKGNIWVSTRQGLFYFNIKKKTLNPYQFKNNKLNYSNIYDLCFDKKGVLWLATDGEGIIQVSSLLTGDFQVLKQGHLGALSSNAIRTLFEDEQSRLWIGTLRGGLNIIDQQKAQFLTITHEPYNKNSLVSNFTFSFCEDEDKNIWIGTDGGGISLWNKSANTFKNYVHDETDKNSLSNNQIPSIVMDDQHRIWVATYSEGINLFNRAKNKFEKIGFSGEEIVFGTWKLFHDSQNNIWASVLRGTDSRYNRQRIYKYNANVNLFEPLPYDIKSDVFAIIEDDSQHLWLGTTSALIYLDKTQGIKVSYRIESSSKCLLKSANRTIWIGTLGRGLFNFNPSTKQIIQYSEKNGLSNNDVLNIEEDYHGNIWASTYKGLTKLNPASGKIEKFYATDGLQSNQFYYNASLRLKSGELIFGGLKGFNIFNPDLIHTRSDFPPISIVGIRVLNQAITANSDYAKNAKDSYNIQQLYLPYSKAFISVDFVAMEYSLPEKIQYAYLLEGWDKEWNYINDLRTINYSHLEEGDYKLKIRSTNPSGNWNPNPKELFIKVYPPWYRTWLAYFLYLSSFFAMVYSYILYIKNRNKLQFEIELSRNKVLNEQKLTERKISFFTNISHELRTPLTMIVNPVKEILQDTKNIEHIDISAVYRNSRRLLSLVDQLLMFKSAENEISDINPSWLNMERVCHEVFLCFTNQVKEKSLDYRFDTCLEKFSVFADREKIEILIFNLLSNAIKFTPVGGSVILSIRRIDDNVEIKVEDTGRGIPEGTGLHLFDKFYRISEEQDTASQSGYGIGLFLVKKYTDLHQGTITYQSELGKGTVFKVLLPNTSLSFETSSPLQQELSHTSTLHLLKESIPEPTFINGPKVVDKDTRVGDLMDGIVNKKPNIILIDDDVEMRSYIKHLLKNNYNVKEADNADTGFAQVLEDEPDLILCDVVINSGSGISGIEFCTKLKTSPTFSHIPVILLTGSYSPEIKLMGIECGADDYITKPFENDLLLARIKNILKARNSIKDYFMNEITLKNNSFKIPNEYSAFLSKCIQIIEKHLQDEQFTVKIFTQEMALSHSNLFRRVKSLSGLTISEFIRYIRLRKAAELMIQTDIQIKEVAFKTGFQDLKYFREQFGKLFEMTPSEFIRRYRKTFEQNQNLNLGINPKK